VTPIPNRTPVSHSKVNIHPLCRSASLPTPLSTARQLKPDGSAGGLSSGQPVMAADDPLGAFRQLHGRLPVVGAVTHALAQDALRFTCMAFGGGDRGQVQSRNLLMWGGQCGQLGGGPRPAETPTWNYTPWLNIAFLFFAAALQRGTSSWPPAGTFSWSWTFCGFSRCLRKLMIVQEHLPPAPGNHDRAHRSRALSLWNDRPPNKSSHHLMNCRQC